MILINGYSNVNQKDYNNNSTYIYKKNVDNKVNNLK